MKSWLHREATYVKVVLEPKLQSQLGGKGGNPDVLKIIYNQVVGALGGEPTSGRWERQGEDIVVGLAL